jgi:hypothetical protein
VSTALVYATLAVLRQAEQLLPAGSVLENLAKEAIERGHLHGLDAGYVYLDEFALAVRFVRVPGRARPRPRAWLLLNVQSKRKSLGHRRGRRVRSGASTAPRRQAGGLISEGSGTVRRPGSVTTR